MRVFRRRHEDRGQAMVEFAIVLPLLLMLLVAVFEFGRAWQVFNVMTDAARHAARSAVVADPTVTQDSVLKIAQNALARGAINPARATITVTGFRTGTGNPATVTIQLPYEFVVLRPFMGWTSAESNFTLTTTFTMRNE